MMSIHCRLWGKYVMKAKLELLDREELEDLFQLEYKGYSDVLYALGEI